MCEWDVLSKEGRILKRTLRQIDCHNAELVADDLERSSEQADDQLAKEDTGAQPSDLIRLVLAQEQNSNTSFTMGHYQKLSRLKIVEKLSAHWLTH